jgi:hypothetical protein
VHSRGPQRCTGYAGRPTPVRRRRRSRMTPGRPNLGELRALVHSWRALDSQCDNLRTGSQPRAVLASLAAEAPIHSGELSRNKRASGGIRTHDPRSTKPILTSNRIQPRSLVLPPRRGCHTSTSYPIGSLYIQWIPKRITRIQMVTGCEGQHSLRAGTRR